jgi:S1-C subfamily serine protease
MGNWRKRLAAAGVAALLSSAAVPAWAVVGASESGARFADHVVMVLVRAGEREGICTGVVLGPRVVLTAAHCLGPTRDMAVHYRDADGKPVLIAVAAAAIHPLYRADAIVTRQVSIDLALVETATSLETRFTPARLAEGDGPPVGAETILAGYGDGREGDTSSAGTLRAARLKVRAPLSSILMWAEDARASGAGACGGDSGGPLFLDDGETVAAIVAWTSGEHGHRCGLVTQGPLIAPQRGWIATTMARWGR